VSLPHLKCSRDIGGEKCFKKTKIMGFALFFVLIGLGKEKKEKKRKRGGERDIPRPIFQVFLPFT